MGFIKKRLRNAPWTEDEVYVPRISTYADAPRPFNNAKPMLVDTTPVVPDARDYRDSFHYREGRDPAHQYSRVTTPLNFNPSFMSQFRDRFVPGAKIGADAQLGVPRTQNRGMTPVAPRVNQFRPGATSYGSQSQNPTTTRVPSGPMAKWML